MISRLCGITVRERMDCVDLFTFPLLYHRKENGAIGVSDVLVERLDRCLRYFSFVEKSLKEFNYFLFCQIKRSISHR